MSFQTYIAFFLWFRQKETFWTGVPFSMYTQWMGTGAFKLQRDFNNSSLSIPLRSRDFYHTCYCLSGLSIAQHFGNQDLHNELILGRDDNRLVGNTECTVLYTNIKIIVLMWLERSPIFPLRHLLIQFTTSVRRRSPERLNISTSCRSQFSQELRMIRTSHRLSFLLKICEKLS